MAKKLKPKRKWYRFKCANHDTCHAVISDGLPHGISIYVEHNMRYRIGAPIVNRLARQMVKWLKATEAPGGGDG